MTKRLMVGDVAVGGGAPVSIQSMCNTKTWDVEATVECDSATYFKSLKLWRLDGDVFIRNVKNERILTEQMFWDQSRHEVRSDSFVRIERSDRIIEGYGFRSDERLANYVILKPSGIFPVPARRDSLNAGSNENQN